MKSALRSLFTTYLSHFTGYVVAAATTVSAVSPGMLPPLGKLAVGVAGLIVFAANHAYQAGTGVAVAQAAVDATAKALTAVSRAPVALMLMVCILVLPLLHGCAQLTAFEASPTGAATISASVDIAVATAEAKGISAVTINTIAHKALLADTSPTATVAAVTAIVQAEVVALKLPAADQAAADILLAALSAAVQAKVGTDATLAAAQTAASVVINDVIAATGG